MMRYTRYYIFLIALIFSAGCSQKQKNVDSRFRSLVDSTYQQIDMPKPKILSFGELSQPYSIMVVDTFLVFQEPVKQYCLYCYNTNNYSFVDSILRKGDKLDEIPLEGVQITQYGLEKGESSVLWVHSLTPYIARLNMNNYKSNVEKGEIVYDKKYLFNKENFDIFSEAGYIFALNDSTFFIRKDMEDSGQYEEGFFVTYWEKYNFYTNQVSDRYYEHKYNPRDILKYPFFNSAYAKIKPDKTKLALFPRGLENFSIFDFTTHSRTDIQLKENGFDIGYAVEYRREEIHFAIAVTNDLIFSLRKDGTGKDYVLVYDWEGAPKYRLSLDRGINCFDVQESTKRLYAISEDYEVLVYDLGGILD